MLLTLSFVYRAARVCSVDALTGRSSVVCLFLDLWVLGSTLPFP